MVSFVIGSDHRGLQLKNAIIKHFEGVVSFVDVSPREVSLEDDYPEIALSATTLLLKGEVKKGILICGSGTGMVIAANRFREIRCAYAHTVEQIKASVHEDDINMIALSADATHEEEVYKMIYVLLNETFDKLDRHQRRIDMLDAY